MKKILLMLIVILSLSCSVSLAYTLDLQELDKIAVAFGQENNFTTTVKAKLITLSETYANCVCATDNVGKFVFYFSDTDYVADVNGKVYHESFYYKEENGEQKKVICGTWVEVYGGSYVSKQTNAYFTLYGGTGFTSTYYWAPSGIHSSEGGMYIEGGTESKLVVYVPDEDFQTTLPEIIGEANLEEVLAEIVGLLPILLVYLASLIGLHKALNFLSQQCHKS